MKSRECDMRISKAERILIWPQAIMLLVFSILVFTDFINFKGVFIGPMPRSLFSCFAFTIVNIAVVLVVYYQIPKVYKEEK